MSQDAPEPEVAARLADGRPLPSAALGLRASRSSGPGGQNVNRRETRVELIVDLERVPLLPAERDRVRARLAGRLDGEGRLVVAASDTRSQRSNRDRALARAVALIDDALVVRPTRVATRQPSSVRAARLRAKARRAETKALRRPPSD